MVLEVSYRAVAFVVSGIYSYASQDGESEDGMRHEGVVRVEVDQ